MGLEKMGVGKVDCMLSNKRNGGLYTEFYEYIEKKSTGKASSLAVSNARCMSVAKITHF